MTNFNNHKIIFFGALRTALIFISGFIIYEILKDLEAEWKKMEPNNHIFHFVKNKSYHFFAMFFIDLIILYLIFYLFNVNL